MYEPKIGEVVTLKSHPCVPMTVTGFNIKERRYSLIWLVDNGMANGIDIVPEALAKFDDGPAAEDLKARVQELTVQCNELSHHLAEVSRDRGVVAAELAQHKAANVRAVLAARAVLSEVRGDAPADDLVREIADRYQTMQAEANAQIERALARAKEANSA